MSIAVDFLKRLQHKHYECVNINFLDSKVGFIIMICIDLIALFRAGCISKKKNRYVIKGDPLKDKYGEGTMVEVTHSEGMKKAKLYQNKSI